MSDFDILRDQLTRKAEKSTPDEAAIAVSIVNIVEKIAFDLGIIAGSLERICAKFERDS